MSQEDTLYRMQMEALGLHRRERITTNDHPENRQYTSVSNLEHTRKELGADYKPPKQSKAKISAWKNVHHDIHDDGTAAPADLQSVNEGLGQTHRAKLIENPAVRMYAGEPDSRRDRYRNFSNVTKKDSVIASQRVSSNQASHERVTRGRVVKGSSASKKSSSTDAKKLVIPALDSVTPLPRKSEGIKTPSERVMESVQRQQQAIKRSQPVIDPHAWIASIQGFKLHAPPGTQVSPISAVTVTDIAKKVPAATKSKTGDISGSQARLTLPARTDVTIQKHEPLKRVSDSSENVAGSHFRQEQVSVPMTSDTGAVSLAYLMSLNIGFTPEQLRLLKAHSRGDKIVDTASEKHVLSKRGTLNPSSLDRHLNATSATLTSTINPKAPLVTYASSSSDSSSNSPTLSKVAPAAATNQAPPVPSVTTKEREEDVKTKARDSSIVSAAKPVPLSIAATPGLSDSSTSLSKPKVTGKTAVSTSGLHSSKKNPYMSLDSAGPINFTLPPTSTLATTTINIQPLLPLDTPSVTALPRSEILRQQREMIIGSQVYKNRYSHLAGSLVDKFKALSLKDPVPTSNQTTATTATPVASHSTSPTSVAEGSPIIELPSRHLLRPQFIPDQPALSMAGLSPSVLAPKSVNNGSEENLRSTVPRSTRSSGLSLPPHLRGKTANTDAGAAARAQYGS